MFEYPPHCGNHDPFARAPEASWGPGEVGGNPEQLCYVVATLKDAVGGEGQVDEVRAECEGQGKGGDPCPREVVVPGEVLETQQSAWRYSYWRELTRGR